MNKALEDLQAGRDPFAAAREDESDPEFYYKAGKWCFWLPIISGIICKLSSQAIQGLPGHSAALSALVALGFSGVLLLGSVVLGIIALCGISKHGTERILVRSVVGLLISFLLLFVMGSGFISGFRRARTDHQLSLALRQSTDDMESSLKQDVEKGHGVSVTRTEASFEKFKTAMDAASQKASGDNALFAKASSAYLQQMQPLMKDYSSALTSLQKPSILDMSGVERREQLAAKKDLVQKFSVSNEKLAAFVKTKGELYRQELQKSGLPAEGIEAALKEYNKIVSPQESELALQIREDDRQMGAALIGMLGILDTNWGHWKYDTARKKVAFEQDAALDQYLSYRDKLDAAAQEQRKLQGKLVSLVSR